MSEKDSPSEALWRVGELARATGLTIRALHHYDDLGLLSPSDRSPAGHRLYTPPDVARLYRITALRRLGFSLQQISSVLDESAMQFRQIVERHRSDATERLMVMQSLNARLARFDAQLGNRDDHVTTDMLLTILEEMTMLDSSPHGLTAILVYDDVAAAQTYLSTVFGLSSGRLVTDASGRAVHAEVLAGDQTIWLHPAAEDYRSPTSVGAVTGMTVVTVDDADAHCDRSRAAGAQVIQEPTNQDHYNVREYGAQDLEGHLWFFHGPLP